MAQEIIKLYERGIITKKELLMEWNRMEIKDNCTQKSDFWELFDYIETNNLI